MTGLFNAIFGFDLFPPEDNGSAVARYIIFGDPMPDEHEDPDHPLDDDTEETLPVQDL